MSYFTPVDHVVLLALAVGLLSGTAISCINAGLDSWLTDRTWHGWDTVTRMTVLYAIVFGLVFSAGAFVLMLYAPSMPLADIDQLFLNVGIGNIIIFPAASWLTSRFIP